MAPVSHFTSFGVCSLYMRLCLITADIIVILVTEIACYMFISYCISLLRFGAVEVRVDD